MSTERSLKDVIRYEEVGRLSVEVHSDEEEVQPKLEPAPDAATARAIDAIASTPLQVGEYRVVLEDDREGRGVEPCDRGWKD